MNALSISGASTKIAFPAGAAIYLLRDLKYNPKIVSGISAGSILTVPLALGLFREIEKYVKEFELKDVFTKDPTNKIIAAWRLITGKESLGTQDKLKETLRGIVTEKRFNTYKSGPYATCYIGCVEFKTGKKEYFNVKTLDYEKYLEVTMASSSIPVFVESRKFDNGYWYDGGIRDHIGSAWLMERNVEMKNHISIYSRPKNFDMVDSLWCPKNVYKVLERTIDIMNAEISKNDEQQEDVLAERYGINSKKIFTPYSLTNNTYEANKELNTKWFDLGMRCAKKVYEN